MRQVLLNVFFFLYEILIDLVNTGNVYIADNYNNRIRKVTVSTGIITTFAGTGTASFSGDGGAATSATLTYPRGVWVDSTGTIHTLFFCYVTVFIVHAR